MRRALILLTLTALLPLPSAAQVFDIGSGNTATSQQQQQETPPETLAEPQLTVDLPEAPVIPGQPVVVRMKVLVPTWLSKPITFPPLEVPNVITRLGERSTTPVSETVNGETWSGVSRTYRLYPMVAGDFAIPPQELQVLYAEPGKTEPLQASLQTPEIRFSAALPQGAEGLSPFVAAERLEISETIEGTPDALIPGASFTRTITAKITGTTPILLPQLLGADSLPGLAAYPAEPVITESENRGVLSGTRVEKTTYVAEAGFEGSLPGVALSWWDLSKNAVQDAGTDPLALFSDGPTPAAPESTPESRLRLYLALAAGALLLLATGMLARFLAPRLKARRTARHAAYLASEAHAYALLKESVAAQDYGASLTALSLWEARLGGARATELRTALQSASASAYGGQSASDWSAVCRAMEKARAAASRTETSKRQAALPPLNPGTPA
ncbi:hypothetical protein [Pseudoruegeria sp. SHC-113]|uniref:hypothetical protein n=1 Tax=Pseudoruegeria sp. SHC-113 TaxID=2855439 RepID=UPI0021BAA860|nr:hypothetical protein [Pseudoruegeria sp. SHC-113]MCT8161386.1 BatD family protein [Pseudoruegeria sp. SHC-113]